MDHAGDLQGGRYNYPGKDMVGDAWVVGAGDRLESRVWIFRR